MKYFIGCELSGTAPLWHRKLSHEIAIKLDIVTVSAPAHITVYPPFEMRDSTRAREIIHKWVKTKPFAGSLIFTSVGTFPLGVVFIRVDPDPVVRVAIEALRSRLAAISRVKELEFPNWNPHVTLAKNLSKDDLARVWKLVSEFPNRQSVLPFDHVSIFAKRDGFWFPELRYPL